LVEVEVIEVFAGLLGEVDVVAVHVNSLPLRPEAR
jgi:hypothetical protein